MTELLINLHFKWISSIFTIEMIIHNKKYLALMASIVLASYLFLSLTTIFHFHHLEILNPGSITKQENNLSKFQQNNNGLNCFVIQNYNSLHTTITNDLSAYVIIIADTDLFISFEQSDNLSSHPFTRFFLRAPPLNFL
jgi:hypothetical protein